MKIKGLKKAVGDYKRYNKGGQYGPEYGELMFDKESGEIWTDYFYDMGHNAWKTYPSESIINLGAMMRTAGYEINMRNIKKFAEEEL